MIFEQKGRKQRRFLPFLHCLFEFENFLVGTGKKELRELGSYRLKRFTMDRRKWYN